MARFSIGGKFRVERHDAQGDLVSYVSFPNGVNLPVLNELLDAFFRNQSQPTNWYAGLIDKASFSAVSSADTSNAHAGWVENEDYDEANRVAWTPIAAASQKLENTASMDFTMNAAVTIKGLFISESNTKGDATASNALWCTGLFDTEQVLGIGEVLKVFYDLTAREG